MLNKTKAALQGRQCHYIESKKSQTITPIYKVNRCDYVRIVGGPLRLVTRAQKFTLEQNQHVSRVQKCTAVKLPRGDPAAATCQPLGSMPCLSNSRRANSFNQFPRLTPSRIAAWFSCSRNSGVIRIWKVGDSPSPFGVLSLLIVDMYVRNPIVWILLCTYVITVYVKIATPRECLQPLPRRLTKPLIEVTIMADTQSTQTRPKYHFRFLALDRANRKATPCSISVDASSEREARRVLAPYFILSLAARLPAYSENHQTASTVTEIEMVEGMVQITSPLTAGESSMVQEVRNA